jgi:hypothetical protein
MALERASMTQETHAPHDGSDLQPRKPWQAPELEIVTIEETLVGPPPGFDGDATGS